MSDEKIDPVRVVRMYADNYDDDDLRAAADEIDRLRAELAEARRLLDEARITLHGIATVTPKSWELPRSEFIDEFLPWAQSRARDTAAKIAAPVPAQPAVPDDVAKDAAEVVAYRIHYPGGAKRLTEDGDVYEHEKRAGLKIDWLGVVGGIDAAILSATEGRSNG